MCRGRYFLPSFRCSFASYFLPSFPARGTFCLLFIKICVFFKKIVSLPRSSPPSHLLSEARFGVEGAGPLEPSVRTPPRAAAPRGRRPPAGGGPRQQHLLRWLLPKSVVVFVAVLNITNYYSNVSLHSLCNTTKAGSLPMATSWPSVPHGLFCLMVFSHPMATLSPWPPAPTRSL